MSDLNRRKSGRLMCAGLFSSLGVVADLSAGGCRVQCTHWRSLPMGGTFHVTLEGDGMAVLLTARIVRKTRLGFRRYEYGLEFIDMTDQQRQMLAELSRITSVKRVMSTMEEAANRAA